MLALLVITAVSGCSCSNFATGFPCRLDVPQPSAPSPDEAMRREDARLARSIQHTFCRSSQDPRCHRLNSDAAGGI